jgi:hypothetical protein
VIRANHVGKPVAISTDIPSSNAIPVNVEKPKTLLGAVAGYIIIRPSLGWRIRDIEQEKG